MTAFVDNQDRKGAARRGLPPLAALRAFEAVGRTGSVRAAGHELAVSHSAISRHVQKLQFNMGVVLVRGSGRGIALTEAGREFHAKISRAFDTIANAAGSLRPSRPSPLNIWCVDSLVGQLVARLAELACAFEDREINLRTISSRADLADMEADAAIGYYDDDIDLDGDLVAHELWRPRIFPIASPAYLAQCASIDDVADLQGVTLLHEESTEQWERWLELAGVVDPAQLRGHRFSNACLAIEAARSGHGVALANDALVTHLLESGALVEVASSDVYMGSYQFIARKRIWTSPAIVTLQQWLERALSISGFLADGITGVDPAANLSGQNNDQTGVSQSDADSA
ncbi:LysR substrate-binding domain-containing protein [Bradyrhizobium sp. CCGUVB14]|uniref:LysR substrate-binding domain-containing protein n=1 Tax=Bradyrhizobium sp. CCGUVB14 TaxID=2949628 RepID=UPI0028119F48|nr:LysR substrate-binding domain-containing protein [Bradyrhizobium sp. CCGUVB14]